MLSNSQPTVRILKRPPNLVSPEQVNGLNSCGVKPQPVFKSLQQRELEYAEARLRIFGTPDPDSEEKLRNDKNQLNEVPKRIIKPIRNEGVIRFPRGPDGTKGFNIDCRETITRLNDSEPDSNQPNIVSNSLLDQQ